MLVDFDLAKQFTFNNAARCYASLEEYVTVERPYLRWATPQQFSVLCMQFLRGQHVWGGAPRIVPISVGEAAAKELAASCTISARKAGDAT